MAGTGWAVALIVGLLLYKGLASLLQRRLRKTLTAMDDLSLLGVPREDGRKIQGTAVICGGSIAGLLSARICSDHFERVVIVEPETWVGTEDGLRDRHREAFVPGSSAPKRSRVAQYPAIHAYQFFNHLALQKLFPHYEREMRRAGALFLASDPALHLNGIPLLVPHHKYPDGIPNSLCFTRPGYETTLRKLVTDSCSNVNYIIGSVTGLIPHPSGNAVSSVLVQTHSGEEFKPIEVSATLVIDCTGPALGGLRWLQEAPFSTESLSTRESPLEPLGKTTYDPKVAYTTCEFSISKALLPKLKDAIHPIDYQTQGAWFTHIHDPRKDSYAMGFQRREADHLQIMCGGPGYRERITSLADIRDFVSKLVLDKPLPGFVHPLLDLLEEAEVPATYSHRRVSARVYVQYFKAAQLPANFIAIGDSVTQLNPVRGEGCTKACIEAVTLNALLANTDPTTTRDGPDALPQGFSRSYFALQAQRVGPIWDRVKIGDYAYSTTVTELGDDPKSLKNTFMRWLGRETVKLATEDREVASDLWHVMHFLAPPTDLLYPLTVLKVVRRSLGL